MFLFFFSFFIVISVAVSGGSVCMKRIIVFDALVNASIQSFNSFSHHLHALKKFVLVVILWLPGPVVILWLPVFVVILWLPVLVVLLWLPVLVVILWLPVLVVILWLPVLVVVLWLPGLVVILWLPVLVVVLWLPVLVVILWLPVLVVVLWLPGLVVIQWLPVLVVVLWWLPVLVVIQWLPVLVVILWLPVLVVTLWWLPLTMVFWSSDSRTTSWTISSLVRGCVTLLASSWTSAGWLGHKMTSRIQGSILGCCPSLLVPNIFMDAQFLWLEDELEWCLITLKI